MDAPQNAAGRVQSLIDRLEITPYQFAKETGLSHQTISNLLTGKNKPSLDTLEAIASRYPGEASWLLTGKAEPVGRTLAPAPRPVAVPTPGLTSGAATVAEAENVLLREQIAAASAQQLADRETIQWLRSELGKSPGSPVATAARTTNPATPAPSFLIRCQRRSKEAKAARVAALEQQAGGPCGFQWGQR